MMKQVVLRKHQQKALDNTVKAIRKGLGKTVGRIVIPTGGGKTYIEAKVIDFQRKENSHTRIHLVLSPRIVLAQQLLAEYRDVLGYDVRALAFHSGVHSDWEEDDNIDWKEVSTTNPTVVQEQYQVAQKAGVDLIVFSTYHSADRLSNIEFDTMIADESQYCVTKNFNKTIQSLQARVKLFFTATEKFTAGKKGLGLNNESIFGKRIFVVSAAELIRLKIIIPPRLHVMYCDTKGEESDSIITQVSELAMAQNKITMKLLGFSKILFALNGTEEVKKITDNLDKLKNKFPKHSIFTITSKTGAFVDGVKIKKEDFLERLSLCTNALIFHYDILSEGIDVDGITGVAIMRNMGLAKLLQTIGRALRIYKPNPKLKPYALVSVPVLNGDEADKDRLRDIIETIRLGGFDISKEDIIETGKPLHQGDEEGQDNAYGDKKKSKAKGILTDILHEIEDTNFLKSLYVAKSFKQKMNILMKEIA
jgi:superfamily II DNA or RNA helicase